MPSARTFTGFVAGFLAGGALLWALCAAWIEAAPLTVLPARYARDVAVQAMMRQCDSDVVIFGDSRSRAGIDPNGLDMRALNLSEGGYNPAVDYYRARQMLQCEHRPKVAILSYSALLYRLFPDFLLNDLFIDRLLTDGEIQEIIDKLEKNHETEVLAARAGASNTPLAAVPVRIRTVLYRTDFPFFYAPSMLASLESGVVARWRVNQETYQATVHNRGQYPFYDTPRSDAVFTDADLRLYPRSVVMDWYFDHLLGMLTDSGIQVLVVTMPINQPTFDAMGVEWRAAQAAYLQELVSKHPGARIVQPVLAAWPSDMFSDSGGHPNHPGAEAVTRLLNHCLKAISGSSISATDATCSMAYAGH